MRARELVRDGGSVRAGELVRDGGSVRDGELVRAGVIGTMDMQRPGEIRCQYCKAWSPMKYFAVLLFFCATPFLSCHKSAVSSGPSGNYVETSPTSSGMTLNFVDPSKVIVTGPQFFLGSPPVPGALTYSMGSDSLGATITFEWVTSGQKNTLTCNYLKVSDTEMRLSFPPCPPGVPCYALGGTVFELKK